MAEGGRHPIYGFLTTILTGIGDMLAIGAVVGLIAYGISRMSAASADTNRTKRSKVEACKTIESEPMRLLCIRGEN